MGYKTATQLLTEEIAYTHRRIERIRHELNNNSGVGPLRAEAYEHQLIQLEQRLIRLAKELEASQGQMGAGRRGTVKGSGFGRRK